MNTPLTPLQQAVVKHYEGGEFGFVDTVEKAMYVNDTLFSYAVLEAGDAAGPEEYLEMLGIAIYQLRTLRDELELT